MRILYVATVGGFMPFFKTIIKSLIDDGHVVDLAANQSSTKIPEYYKEWGCNVYDISTSRSPFSYGNVKSIKEIKELANNYDIVHCHTPLASMATRLACRRLRKKQGLKVIYTAHGFHFYNGAPKKNWIIYYPIEKVCSRLTDVLITINKEDYGFAKKKLKTKVIKYIPGVGIDTKRFAEVAVDIKSKKQELGIPEDSKIVLSIGELNENKNQEIVIKALHRINDPKIHYLIAGRGDKKDYLDYLAKDMNVNLHLLGYRNDVGELYKVADLFVHPSFREGLPVSIMEALASGLPCVASNIRGCRDLVKETDLFSPSSEEELSKVILRKLNEKTKKSNEAISLIEIDQNTINAEILEIYSSLIKKD